jgi:hypothetical protein
MTVRPWSAVAYVPSACLVARTNVLGTGFDPRLRCGEDVDLVWRLHDAGHRVRHVADVELAHDAPHGHGVAGRGSFYGTSAALLAARHGSKAAPGVLSRVGAVAIAGVLLQRRWSWTVTAGATLWSLRESRRRLPELSAPQYLLTHPGRDRGARPPDVRPRPAALAAGHARGTSRPAQSCGQQPRPRPRSHTSAPPPATGRAGYRCG